MAEFKEQLQNVDHVDHTRKQSFQEATMDRSDASDIDHNDSGMTSLSQPNVLRDELTRTDEHTNDTKPSNEPKHRREEQEIPPHQKAKKISMGKKGDIQYTVVIVYASPKTEMALSDTLANLISVKRRRGLALNLISAPHEDMTALWINSDILTPNMDMVSSSRRMLSLRS
eukprot:445964_1